MQKTIERSMSFHPRDSNRVLSCQPHIAVANAVWQTTTSLHKRSTYCSCIWWSARRFCGSGLGSFPCLEVVQLSWPDKWGDWPLFPVSVGVWKGARMQAEKCTCHFQALCLHYFCLNPICQRKSHGWARVTVGGLCKLPWWGHWYREGRKTQLMDAIHPPQLSQVTE